MSTSEPAPRPWIPAHLEATMRERVARYRTLRADAVETELADLVAAHERAMDRESISLYAGTNVMNPRAARWLTSTIGSRPSLGWPGDKYETGMRHAEQLDDLATAVLTDLFGCRYAEFRVGSGALANLYAFLATTSPGDHILALPDAAAGHVTHHAAGAAGLRGLTVGEVPWDGRRMTIDLDRLATLVRSDRPRLIVVGGSMNLYAHDVASVRAIADEVGAYVLYDAAHVAGLIAAGRFQQPLTEGAHLLTCSTYKSFGGPPHGLVLTDGAELAERLDRIAYPGLTANFDLGSVAALTIAALDLREHGPAYADACIAAARALAEGLAARGVPVAAGQGRGPTDSHHLAIPADRFGGGTAAARRLEGANLLASAIGLPVEQDPGGDGIRLGTQETTRWGMGADVMPAVAALIARVLIGGESPASVRRDAIALRADYQVLHHIRSGPESVM